MSEFIEVMLKDEPGLHVTTGRGEVFHFIDGDRAPDVTGLAAAVLVTRLRWWADHIEAKANTPDVLRGVPNATRADA